MNLTEKIAGIFPAETDIPEFYRLDNPVDQSEYLVNGELRRWSGPMQEVLSPVYVKTAGGADPKGGGALSPPGGAGSPGGAGGRGQGL